MTERLLSVKQTKTEDKHLLNNIIVLYSVLTGQLVCHFSPPVARASPQDVHRDP